MLRKWGTLVLFLLATPILALAQNTGKLSGVVLDASTGEPLPGANVVIEGTQLGTATDVDGSYFILAVPVGAHTIRASFVGYTPQTLEGVEVSSGYTTELNFELSPGTELEEIVVEYERPIIQKDAIGVSKVVSADELQNLPVRGLGEVAALQAGVVRDADGNLFIRGGREQEVTYYVDGVKVIGGSAVPTQAIQEQEMLIGSLPAKYGDAMSGVINITTKSGAPQFYGSIEGITSEVLDAYGYNTLAATFGGPILRDKLSFFVSGQFGSQLDASPRAIGFPTLDGVSLDELNAAPQAVRAINDETGEVIFVPFPGDVQDGESAAAVVERIVVPEGYSLAADHPVPTFRPLGFTSENFTREDARPNDEDRELIFNGNLTFNPLEAVRIRAGGGYEQSRGNEFSLIRSLYAPESFRKDDRNTWRAFGSWTHYLSNSTLYQIQASYTDYKGWQYWPGFSREVGDIIHYGDIDNDINAVARRYMRYDEATDTYVAAYGDGSLPNLRDIHSTWSPPGMAPSDSYNKWHYNRLGLRANATTQIGIHQIEFGGEYEKQTRRSFSTAPIAFARYFADDNPEIGSGVTSWSQLAFSEVRTATGWYGYNYLGTKEVDDQNVDRFTDNSLGTSDPNRFNIAPYEPIYYAGYIQDKIEYRDLVLNIGFRLDVFDNNTLILRDPFALFPITRANTIADRPANIGADYAVYFNNNGQVVGYRDLDGNFYRPNGTDAQPSDVTQAGTPKATELRMTSEVFKDYEPQVNLQPRIGVSFPVTDQALFFASYDVVTQRPSEYQFETIHEWLEVTELASSNANSALLPERTTNYELGFRQRVGARAAFTVSGFYRSIENKISERIVHNAYPNNYQTYYNVDFGTVRGVEFEFDLRRTRNVSLNANYTLSFAQGTGADADATSQINWRQETDPFYPRFISPLDFDQRHKLNLTLDYRLGENEGPQIFGAQPLANFGVNVVATVTSGMPYTLREDTSPIYNAFNGFLEGGINEQQMPSSTMLNLRIDRRFSLGGSTNLVAFLWVQNLLDSDNVVDVYAQTGLADNDGYLSNAEGIDYVAAIAESQSALEAQAFSDHYRLALKDPFNYGIPRTTRLGLRLDF